MLHLDRRLVAGGKSNCPPSFCMVCHLGPIKALQGAGGTDSFGNFHCTGAAQKQKSHKSNLFSTFGFIHMYSVYVYNGQHGLVCITSACFATVFNNISRGDSGSVPQHEDGVRL